MKSDTKKGIVMFGRENSQDLQKVHSTADGQIAIPIKKPKNEIVYGLKRRVNKSVTYAGVIPYWRNFYFVLAFLVSIFTTLVTGVFIFLYYDKFPALVPLIYNQASKLWGPIGKEDLIAIPITIAVFTILNTYLNAKIFQFDRRLVMMLNISVVLACIFLLVALAQIFSLLFVY